MMKKVAAAVIENNGKVLIAKRKENDYPGNKWEFPGGKIKNGETPEECIKRELMEEFNIEVEVKDFITSSKHTYKDISVELIAYKTSYISGDFKLNCHKEMKWVRPEEIKNYDLADADWPIADKLLE